MTLLRWLGVLCLFALACGESQRDSRSSESEGGTSGTGGRGGVSGSTAGGTAGGTAGAGGSAGVSDEWVQVCERTAEGRCQQLEECVPFLHAVAPADCEAWAARLCEGMVRDAHADLPFTPAEYERCADARNEASCDDAFYNLVVPPECDFNGGRPGGSPCDISEQCEDGWCSTIAYCGECERYVGLDGPCFLGVCGPGLACGPDLTCVPTRIIGDSCNEQELCLSTLVCEDGECARPPAPGEPCSTVEQRCDVSANARCNFTTLECEALPTANHGEPCTDTDVMCLDWAYCYRSVEPATCEPVRAEGESCNDTDLLCDVTLSCLDGVCGRPNPERCE